ncbi:hypothetical protein NliqN6_1209 [Naganishia liquefaciens]|uniref:RRM domain-containing protein n=1 Tax=Naganishia liquefaciens TaxID=104408 RepID=A0A8H3YE13_9TREE|nr:hypothetical protein NliqN6_1209 [Naganishia liquefaciens]
MSFDGPKCVLHVSGFPIDLRARDLAYEFERYGRLVRCDIPALKTAQSTPFAFVEFRDPRDAEDAYYEMHGKPIDGRRISIQWAKRPPSQNWRYERGGGAPYRDDRRSGYGGGYGSSRGRSPPPSSRRSPSPYGRRGDPRDDRDDRRRSRSPARGDERRRSRSPVGSRRGGRSASPNGNVDAADAERIDDAVNDNVRGEAGSDERDQ